MPAQFTSTSIFLNFFVAKVINFLTLLIFVRSKFKISVRSVSNLFFNFFITNDFTFPTIIQLKFSS